MESKGWNRRPELMDADVEARKRESNTCARKLAYLQSTRLCFRAFIAILRANRGETGKPADARTNKSKKDQGKSKRENGFCVSPDFIKVSSKQEQQRICS